MLAAGRRRHTGQAKLASTTSASSVGRKRATSDSIDTKRSRGYVAVPRVLARQTSWPGGSQVACTADPMFDAVLIEESDDRPRGRLTQVDEADLPEGDATVDVA